MLFNGKPVYSTDIIFILFTHGMIQRTITPFIDSFLFKKKHIILYWPRQVGKTTLAKYFLKKYGDIADYYTAEEADIVSHLTNATSTSLGKFFGTKKIVVIDEAQKIPNIWTTLKLMHDFFPEVQVIATWSSSFDLANTVNEPLTGRKFTFMLYPFSLWEIYTTNTPLAHQRLLPTYMQYWLYPDVHLTEWAIQIKNLQELTQDYLYKDILSFQQIRKPDLIFALLQALALQLWSEVSYTELAGLLSVNKQTIEQYITILEQAFIIYRLPSFHRNMRNELKKSKKIYFRDTWIRNALIKNINSMDLRTDQWALRENFVLNERKKHTSNTLQSANYYFWRTTDQQEIDILEEQWWHIWAYECKRTSQKARKPLAFLTHYPQSTFACIHPENIRAYAGIKDIE